MIHLNCLKITINLKKWLERIMRNNALLLLGRASPHDPDTHPMNPILWLSAGLSNHCPPSVGC